MNQAVTTDYFVSYNKADQEWARWIAWQLEATGYTVVIQAFDFRPGSNFVLDMQRAASTAEHTVAVLSPDSLQAEFTQLEWSAAVKRDPTGKLRTFMPVRVRECEPTGIFAPIVYVDLVGVSDKAEAVTRLLEIAAPRSNPSRESPLPVGRPEPDFPGLATGPRQGPSRPPSRTRSDENTAERELIRESIERARGTDAELAAAIQFCAIPRRITPSVIGLLKEPPADEETNGRLFRALQDLPFVETRDDTCVYRESARAALLADWQSPERAGPFATLTARLVEFYETRETEAQSLEQDLARVTGVIQQASRSRRKQLSESVDRALITALRERVYHTTMSGPEGGYQVFLRAYEHYESRGRVRICEALIPAFEDALEQVTAFPRRAALAAWLQYWKARLALSLGRYAEADEILRLLERNVGDDETTLKLWVLGDRGSALQGQSKLREARALYTQALTVAHDTAEDAFNRPVWKSRIASLLVALDELEGAEQKYRETIQSAEELKNFSAKADALLSVSSVYQEMGRWNDALNGAFEALHLIREHCQEDDLLECSLRKTLMALLSDRDPAVLETLYQEACAITDMGDPDNRLALQRDYVDVLRDGGRLKRANEVLSDLWSDATAQSDTSTIIKLLFSKAELADAQGNVAECVDFLKEILDRSQADGASIWERAQAFARLANAHLAAGLLDQAEADAANAQKLWDAIGHESQAALLQITLAQVRRRQGRSNEAAELLDHQRGVGSPGARAQQHMADGDLNRTLGRMKNALQQYRQAVDVRRTLADVRGVALSLARVSQAAASQGAWEIAAESAAEAAGIWRRLTEANSYRPSAAQQLADADNARGLRLLRTPAAPSTDGSRASTETLQSACEAFRSAISRMPDNFWYHLNLAYASSRLTDWDGAASAVDRVLSIARERRLEWLAYPRLQVLLADFRSRQSQALMADGDRLMNANDVSGAGAQYQNALRIIPDSASDLRARQAALRVRLALVAFRLQDVRAARTGFERAIKLYGESGDSRPGAAVGAVCRSFLQDTRSYWALDDDWAAFLESERRDRELRRHLSDARLELAGYLDAAYRLNDDAAERSFAPPIPVVLELGAALIPANTRVDSWTLFTTFIPAMRRRIAEQSGVEVPGVIVRRNDALPPTGYACLIDEIPVTRGTLPEGAGFCLATSDRLKEIGVNVGDLVDASRPEGGEYGCWVPAERWPIVVRCGIELWRDPLEFVVRHLEAVVRRHLTDLFGVDEAERLLSAWRATEKAPSSIDAILPDEPARFRFGRLLRALAGQGVPLTEWRPVLRSVQARQKATVSEIVQVVRTYMKERLPGNAPTAERVSVPDDWEGRLLAAFRDGRLRLSPSDAHQFTWEIRQMLLPWSPNRVLVCRRRELRPFVQYLLRPEFPDLHVLAEDEVMTQPTTRPDANPS